MLRGIIKFEVVSLAGKAVVNAHGMRMVLTLIDESLLEMDVEHLSLNFEPHQRLVASIFIFNIF